ncbi:N-terminal domain [Lecanosticta acicola]|uniref:Enhancer of mRNA-decapping protein 3 n=1 Tax=Lecanosticta acicola TaxID=111012 RepID=A0AAI8Z0I4_9PEZI|nr:N-terminal domain [Lecanosticta acicola]
MPQPIPHRAMDQQRHVSTPTELPANAPTPQRATFVDPAILRYGNASPTRAASASNAPELETPIKSLLAKAAANLPSPSSPFIADAGKANANITQKLKEAANRQNPSKSPVLHNDPVSTENNLHNAGPAEPGSKKKARRGPKPKKQSQDVADPPPVMNSEVSRNGNNMNGSVKRGKGWRSGPFLQPSPQPNLDQANTKKSRRKQREEMAANEALGDTTGIEDMGEFDFVGELSKFDKKKVFDEIRQGDTTADEDRLVSHNRVARPGTYGGKNLHPSEPVLSPKVQPVNDSKEVSSASEADTELNLANGRSSSKHSTSRLPKSKPSRQNSAHVDIKPHPLSASVSSDRNLNRSTTSLRGKTGSLAASSPRPDRANSPHSAVSTRVADHASHFALLPQMTTCPTLLPRALDSLELAAVSSFGLTYDAIIEMSARSIVEAALQLSNASPRRPSRTTTFRGSVSAGGSSTLNDTPVAVVLAGNHSLGARALAAGRHLLGRNYRVILAESLFESADTQDPHMKAQTGIIRRMARGGANAKRGLWKKAFQHIKNLSGPPAVIIDALLCGSTYDSLLSPNVAHSIDAQSETREMIEWANRSRAPVLSVGCPSGISGIDGLSTIVDGEPLAVRPDHVIALGAPMQGLLKAMESGERWDSISVADIGTNIALRSDEAVAFGGSYVAELKFVGENES